MRTPEEAIREIVDEAPPLGECESVPLFEALGRVLAQDVHSDVDIPPFQKSAMDGYALRSAEIDGHTKAPGQAFEIVGESRAGGPFGGSVPPGACISIYTGAQVPPDCDAVVMIEKTSREGDSVHIDDHPGEGQNICNRGADLRSGDLVLRQGRRLSATDLSVLAAVGCDPTPVFRRPRVAILTTGDELVPPSEQPGVGQIREGNTLHLAALAQRAGADVLLLGLVRDDKGLLEERFRDALERSDVVVTTGGVSMGKYDHVAEVFQRCGVEEIFHKVAIKPGKPMWFGKLGKTLVFGLPGNPVSCLLDHEVFVRPALARLEGARPEEWAEERRRIGRWAGAETRSNPRQQNLPIRVRQGADGVDELLRLDWSSSADIVGLAEADGMAIVAAGETIAQGDLVPYRPLR